jgi:hypothetical protein
MAFVGRCLLGCCLATRRSNPLQYYQYRIGSIVGWGTMLQVGRLWVWVPMKSLDFFDQPNPSIQTMAVESIQPLTEMSTRNLPGVEGSRCVRLTTSQTSVSWLSRKIWEPQHLTALGPWRPVTGIALPFIQSRHCTMKQRTAHSNMICTTYIHNVC